MKKRNFKLMLASNGVAYFAFNLVGPFLVLVINQKGGGIENLGLLLGVSLLFSSITSFFIGTMSDKFGRKPFLIASSFAASVIIVLYPYVYNLTQLYILQILSGINNAIWVVSESIFMADITEKKTRGKSLGFYNMFLGIIMAFGLMLGGFAINRFGYTLIFWFVGITSFISAIILLWLKEKR